MIINKMKNKSEIIKITLCVFLIISLCVSVFSVTTSALQNKITYHNMKVILGGAPFGVKFNTVGVVVVGFSDIDGVSKSQNPAYLAGLRQKDIITKVNGRQIRSASELTQTVESSNGDKVSLTFSRLGEEKTIEITPLFSRSENKYKTGVWVKDSGAGIGTVTYILPDSLEFGGLGHGICDGETGELIPIRQGTVMDVSVNAVKKGVPGTPGEIKGYFGTQKLGQLNTNTDCGVFGKLDKLPSNCGEIISVAMRDEIVNGEAYIVCTLDGGAKEQYRVEISSINKQANGSKCFIIKITDQNLIEKTGGIVQGMSGSPIIQNGKLVGAVTHVLINDPTTGYGIFIENMLNAANIPMAKAS